MPNFARTKLSFLGSCLALLVAAGCGGNSPTKPSSGTNGRTGAVIAGTVTSLQASADGATHATGVSSSPRSTPQATSQFSGLKVTIVGTDLSAVVGATGAFEIAGVPAGKVLLQFKGDAVDAATELSNVTNDQFIEIQVQLSGTSAVIVGEARSHKVSLCHTEGTGDYHLIDVSEAAEAAHRAHGDGKIGDPVPGQPGKTFDSNCRPVGPSVDIEKLTNGEDADSAPGPSIVVGNPVTWEYRVSNIGTVTLTGITVVDDRGVAVNCAGQTTLAAGATMTCTGTGVAVLGQYSNVGTVTANWAVGAVSGTVTDSDRSHYLGVTSDESGPKVTLCHRTGAGFYVMITVSIDAEPAHRAHGDGKIGEAVPNLPGKVFGAGCSVQ